LIFNGFREIKVTENNLVTAQKVWPVLSFYQLNIGLIQSLPMIIASLNQNLII
jgi:hypothetical protein